MKYLIHTIFLIAFLFLFGASSVNAQSQQLSARIESFETTLDDQNFEIQIYYLTILEGENAGKTISVDSQYFSENLYNVGDSVIVSVEENVDGQSVYYIIDHNRKTPLLVLSLIFIVLVLLVARMWGLRSLFGLSVSFAVIFGYILPEINAGINPIYVAITGSLFVMFVTFYLSHGINKKTNIAILGTFITLVLTGVMASIYVNVAKLTGYASEETLFLAGATPQEINVKGLLMAGIIISALGVLDDITISQASVVKVLNEANPKYGPKKLFTEAMKVGHDHISSLVNTLIMVYAGSSLPLLLLFLNSNTSYSTVVNYEIIAEEIVKALIGSSCLILAVPITTFIAVYVYSNPKILKF